MLNLWFKYSTVKKPLRSQWDFWLSLVLALAGVLMVPGLRLLQAGISGTGWNNTSPLVLLVIVNLLVLVCLVITSRHKESAVRQGEFYICVAYNCAVLLLLALVGTALQLPLFGLVVRMAQRMQSFESNVVIMLPLVVMLTGAIYGILVTLRLVVCFCNSMFLSQQPGEGSAGQNTGSV